VILLLFDNDSEESFFVHQVRGTLFKW